MCLVLILLLTGIKITDGILGTVMQILVIILSLFFIILFVVMIVFIVGLIFTII